MMIKKLSLAVAGVALASQAVALAPTATVDLEFVISGATAVDKQVANYIDQICKPGTIDIFNNPADTASSFFCEVDAAASGLATDKNVLFRKESGGSSTGVEPVTNALTVTALDMSTCTFDSGINWTCSDTTIQVPSEVGISDVEPELFAITDNGSKNVNLSAPLTVSPVNAQTFGVVVSPGLRDALQTAQGLTAGSDEVDQMPSLSSAVIANIFAGNVSTWDQLRGLGGAGLATADGTLSNTAVNVCVRTPGSGTQAQFNAFYMLNACAYRGAGDLGYLGFNTAIDSNGVENDSPVPTQPFPPFAALPGPHIHKNKGSSDMGRCLTNVTADDRWAIGVQSLEKVDEGRTNRNNFKYLAIDGVTPTLENVAAGLYRNWAAASIQWRNDVVTGDKLILANKLVETARDVNAVRTFNISLQTDDATSNDDRPGPGLFNTPEILDGGVPANVGTLAFAGGVNPIPNYPFDETNPVFGFNKGLVGPSSCASTSMSHDVDVTKQN